MSTPQNKKPGRFIEILQVVIQVLGALFTLLKIVSMIKGIAL
jgi:hypothetical protein